MRTAECDAALDEDAEVLELTLMELQSDAAALKVSEPLGWGDAVSVDWNDVSGDCETPSLTDGVSETCAVGDEFAEARLERDAVVLGDCDALDDSVDNEDTD